MGKWIGAWRFFRSGVTANPHNNFVKGLKVLEPVFFYGILLLLVLFVFDYVAGTDIIQTLVYTVSIYAFRYRTLIQMAPLVDQFTPAVLRVLGLGTGVKIVVIVGAFAGTVAWMQNRF